MPTSSSDTIVSVLQNIGTTAAVIGVLWAITKDKIAADLVPRLSLHFASKSEISAVQAECSTSVSRIEKDLNDSLGSLRECFRTEISKLGESLKKDLESTHAQMPSIAKHKAEVQTAPLEARVDSIENRLAEMKADIKDLRSEHREEFQRVIDTIQKIKES